MHGTVRSPEAALRWGYRPDRLADDTVMARLQVYKIHDQLFLGLAGLGTDAQTLCAPVQLSNRTAIARGLVCRNRFGQHNLNVTPRQEAQRSAVYYVNE